MNIHSLGGCLRFVAQQRRFLLLIFYIAVIAVLYYLPGVFHPHSVEEIRVWVMGFGVWGPLVYVALYTVRPLLLFPGLLLNLAAGILFPPAWGIPLLLLGGLGSATLLFVMARTGVGSTFFRLHGGCWGKRIHTYVSESEQSFIHMLWLRTVPLFPYDVISMVAGCTHLSYRIFAFSTLLGMLPGAVAYNVLGDSLGGNAGWGRSLLLTAAAFGIPLLIWYFGGERKKLKSGEQVKPVCGSKGVE